MGDYVGVDPVRVRKLADRLGDLEQALAKHGALIRKNFKSWDSGLDLSLLAQQTGAVGDDARDMSKRADLARNLEEVGGAAGMCTPDGDIIDIPWDMKDVSAQSTKEAQQEAATLKKALDNPKADGSRADIDAIGRSLADHQDDPAYLAAFAGAGGIVDAARVARALHEEDGTHGGDVLSKDSQRLVGVYATGINRVFTLQEAGKIPSNPDYIKALTDPPGGDMVSVGMLFKYGPPGDQWEPHTLSKVSGAMLDWRDKQKTMRPSYSKPDFPYSAGGYAGKDDGGWYHAWGLNPDYLVKGADDNQRIVDGIEANDPVLAVINRTGENADASRDLLGHDDAASKRYAQDLLDFKWQTPGPTTVDDSDGARRVLTLAATDRSAAHFDQSGQAAANILAAAVKEKDAFDQRNGHEKDEYPTYPNGTAIALAGITGTWSADTGGTGMTTPGGTSGYDANDHALVENKDDMVKVMQLFVKDNSSAAAMFDATLHAQVSEAAALGEPDEMLTAMGNTAGMLTKAKVGISYTEAQQIDEQHKMNAVIVDSAGTLFGFIPGPKDPEGVAKIAAKALKYSQNMVSLGRTFKSLGDPFSTDNAGKQESLNRKEAETQYTTFSPSIAQGMIRAGKWSPPANRDWYDPQTKTINPDAMKSADFQGWFNTEKNEKHLDETEPFERGFNHAEVSKDGK
ncbi:hypothetical protein OHB10_20220 [Streptomyces sp. NBC_01597]|uniref:hypothetical protein n=1 Tax=Streptomyces sp. NBC_01597 TaxID=2975891 RepID=UPI00386C4D25